MKLDTLDKLFLHELQDLHSAEKQITEALPKMVKASQSKELQKAFQDHLKETEGQLKRLNKVFDELGKKPGKHKCKGMEGLLKEGEEIIEADADPDVRDAALIAAAQRVEHYEMAGYGTARTLARQLGHQKVADLLHETLEEEGAADRKLTQLAEKSLNLQAQAS